MTTQAEAAKNGLFWLVLWDGQVVEYSVLDAARLRAFQECEALVQGHYSNEGERTPTGASFMVFEGRRCVSRIDIHQPDPDTTPHFVWSPPRSDELNDITPEEYAHLIQRRQEPK